MSNTNSNPSQPQSSGVRIHHGVIIRSDPVLKVFIEHTLAQERAGVAQYNYLHKSNTIPLDDDEHIFLTNSSHDINSEMIEEGLQVIVSQWMKDNSFAQLDDEASDDE